MSLHRTKRTELLDHLCTQVRTLYDTLMSEDPTPQTVRDRMLDVTDVLADLISHLQAVDIAAEEARRIAQ